MNYFVGYHTDDDGPAGGMVIDFTPAVVLQLHALRDEFHAMKARVPGLLCVQVIDATPVWLDDHHAEPDTGSPPASGYSCVESAVRLSDGTEVSVFEADDGPVRLHDERPYDVRDVAATGLPRLEIEDKGFSWTVRFAEYDTVAKGQFIPWEFLDNIHPE